MNLTEDWRAERTEPTRDEEYEQWLDEPMDADDAERWKRVRKDGVEASNAKRSMLSSRRK